MTVRREGGREVSRKLEHYNLDVIISVGYRVKSKHATQFRIWATNVLRDHLVKGYTLNEKRLQESKLRLKELGAAVELVQRAKSTKALTTTSNKNPPEEGFLLYVPSGWCRPKNSINELSDFKS